MTAKILLKRGRDKSLRRRHPWVFSGAIERIEGKPEAGATVSVVSADGETLATAAFSPKSQIQARVWRWGKHDIGAAFFHDRIQAAAARRALLLSGTSTNAARLVHGESDGLPGVVADRYGDTVVLQLLSAGAERWREDIADAVASLPGVTRVWERSDADVRGLEGLQPRVGLLRGTAGAGNAIIEEHGLQYAVDIEGGQKSGFYLDQRDNRARLRAVARGADVLDCFCYSGGFAINASTGGAKSVTAIESASLALDAARANAAANRCGAIDWMEADVFQALRGFRDRGRSFDIIVLDPPKFAPTAAHAEKAARAYKDINLLGFKLLKRGGLLMTYSCSGGISPDLFQKIVAGAALDAGVDAQVEGWLHAAGDHPVALNFPEGEYLKGLMVRIA